MTGLSEAEKRALALADNKISERGVWLRSDLALELSELALLHYPRKERQEIKIDRAIALIMAIGLNVVPDDRVNLDEFLANAVMV